MPKVVDRILGASRKTLDAATIRRVLPHVERRFIGPFVFVDHMGPATLGPGVGVDVRPHPHIGLATVTYLFEGELLHRDSLGIVQPIRPGAVNWMVAGRGVVHSERTPPELRPGGSRLSGVQVWLGLPQADEECEPTFSHHPSIPVVERDGVRIEVIAGELFGERSPVATRSNTVYAHLVLPTGTRLALPGETEELGCYVLEGTVALGDDRVTEGQLAVLRPGGSPVLEAVAPSRVMLLGGARLDGPRHLYWNFVSSSRERLQRAGDDWREGRFPGVPGETDFIPLPPSRPPPVHYP